MLRALDLFCCGGGISRGLQMAGFDVVGVDVHRQPHYLKGPGMLGAVFVQADALVYLSEVIAGEHGHFDLIHASPPCQAHTSLRHLHKDREYVDLIPETRELLRRWGGPWMMENVPGAPLGGANLTMLCGTMFGLQTPDGRAELRRHRLFETSFSIPLRPACQHGHIGFESVSVTGTGMGVGGRARWKERRALNVTGHNVEINAANWPEKKVLTVCGHTPVDNTLGRREVITVTGSHGLPGKGRREKVRRIGGRKAMSGGMSKPQGMLAGRPAQERETFGVQDARAAMGIDWMPMSKLSQAIPPAYAHWLGLQAIDHIRFRATRQP